MPPLDFSEQSPPQFQLHSASLLNISAGDVARLKCRVAGAPRPYITWTKDGAELQVSKRIKITNYNQTVKIFSVSVEDVGTYRCRAQNALGVINATMYLHVMPGMCTVLQKSTNTKCAMFSIVRASCNIANYLMPHFVDRLTQHIAAIKGYG